MHLFVALAFADTAEPPDVGVLEDRGRVAFVAPPACGRWRWEVEQTAELVGLGKEALRAEGEARLANGVWTEARWSVVSDTAPRSSGGRTVDGAVVPFAPPILGKLVGVDPSMRGPPSDPAEADEAPDTDGRAAFERLITALSQEVEILDVQAHPVEGEPGWLVQHWFRLDTRPGPRDNSDVIGFGFDASLQPRTLSVRVGKPRDVGRSTRSWRLVHLDIDASLDAEGGPVREVLSLEGVWALFRFRLDRTLRYARVAGC